MRITIPVMISAIVVLSALVVLQQYQIAELRSSQTENTVYHTTTITITETKIKTVTTSTIQNGPPQPSFSKELIGYSVSVGLKKPGEDVGIQLYAKENKVELPGPIKVSLILLDKDEKDLEVVAEEILDIQTLSTSQISVRFMLPEKAPAKYHLSTVFTDQDGNIVDTLIVATLEVPKQELNASISLNKEEFLKGDALVLTIHNEGPTVIEFGEMHWVEYFKDGEWVHADWLEPSVWILVGYMLFPGGSWSQSVELGDTPLGAYRISKEVKAIGTDLDVTLTATFQVVKTS